MLSLPFLFFRRRIALVLLNHRKCQKAHSGIVSSRQGLGQSRTLARRLYKKIPFCIFIQKGTSISRFHPNLLCTPFSDIQSRSFMMITESPGWFTATPRWSSNVSPAGSFQLMIPSLSPLSHSTLLFNVFSILFHYNIDFTFVKRTAANSLTRYFSFKTGSDVAAIPFRSLYPICHPISSARYR